MVSTASRASAQVDSCLSWPENGPRVLVFGNRTFTCSSTIRAWLLPLQAQWIRAGTRDDNAPTVIHGAADGADKIAHGVALDLGFKVLPFPISSADWNAYRKRAGYVRNRQMADEGKPHFGLGFGKVQKDPRKVDRSGSGHMLDILNELGIRVTMIAQPGDYPGVFR